MSWFGYRNLAYIIFMVLLILYASFVNGGDPAGRRMSAAFVTMLWIGVSVPFFVANAVLLGIALTRERPASKPPIAVLLAMLTVVVPLTK